MTLETDFYTLKRLPPYVFAEVNAMKAKARAAGKDIIDMGMGTPDLPTPQHIVRKLRETIKDPRTHRYSVSKGIPGLRKALAGYYDRRFNVDLDPEKEVIVTLGSKEGLANLAKAITSPGETILSPNPSYPMHAFGFVLAGANVRQVPVEPDENFLPAVSRALKYSVPKPLALILCYPSNPTAKVASLDFYKEVVDFCIKNEIYLISDIAYAEVYYDGNPPPSVLQVPRAKEVAVEFYSLSKSYSMSGWRVGFASGNRDLIKALTRIKSYLDYGLFTPIQVAATEALNGPQDCLDVMRQTYKGRRDILVSGMKRMGWDVTAPLGSMFLWAKIPPAFLDRGIMSMEFTKLLLENAEVACSPGLGFGEQGDEYVRFSLIENKHRTRQALQNMKQFFGSHGYDLDRAGKGRK